MHHQWSGTRRHALATEIRRTDRQFVAWRVQVLATGVSSYQQQNSCGIVSLLLRLNVVCCGIDGLVVPPGTRCVLPAVSTARRYETWIRSVHPQADTGTGQSCHRFLHLLPHLCMLRMTEPPLHLVRASRALVLGSAAALRHQQEGPEALLLHRNLLLHRLPQKPLLNARASVV